MPGDGNNLLFYTETGAALQAAQPFQGIYKTLYAAHYKLFSI